MLKHLHDEAKVTKREADCQNNNLKLKCITLHATVYKAERKALQSQRKLI